MKGLYVTFVRGLRRPLEALGVLSFLEARRDVRPLFWLRTLFAIHDVEDMVSLDIPWWSLSAVDAVDAHLRDRPEARVFEYGSGASTVWLSRRAATVTSVEHDERWAQVVRTLLLDRTNVDLRVVEATVSAGPPAMDGDERFRSGKAGWRDRDFERYVRSIESAPGPFDVVVVDGRARTACFTAALEHLAPGGMILFDNSARHRYRSALDASPLRAERHGGWTACLPYVDPTTLFREPPG